MTISTGDKLPASALLRMGDQGPETVDLAATAAGRKIVIFAVPGAFTPTCHSAHVPSFMRNMDALRAKGVDEVICYSVNDPFIMKSWGEVSGASDAGITMLADADAAFTKSMGLEFSAPPVGLYDRPKRVAMIVEDGTVTALHIDEDAGTCVTTAGEAILEALG